MFTLLSIDFLKKFQLFHCKFPKVTSCFIFVTASFCFMNVIVLDYSFNSSVLSITYFLWDQFVHLLFSLLKRQNS